ncbi:glycosyltransferase [Jeotgalibaca caeni]|uniref:glycosyltransferase n=1 Tax=Jeotgalibaca caeni TaxID=3028623 RepID=UPI00237E65DA|nr:glycosyltransferase [Jeotgalibaca caeni]MDE1548154.1 glycosyltransferase [Jeotgalibaca caeni]
MKKLKILHYIPGFNTGGIESVFLNWYRHLPSDAVEFELLVRNYSPDSPLLKEYLELGGKLHTLDTPSLNIKSMMAFYRKVNQFFAKHHEYDFLHVHVADDPFVIQTARRRGIKAVGIHAHTTGYNESYKSQGLKGKIRNHNVKDARYHLAITNAAAAWMFPEKNDVQIIHNGIDAAQYAFNAEKREAVRSQLQLDNRYTIMHVGRFSEVKNHLFMLEVFEKVRVQIPSSVLVFVGDGPLYSEIREEITKRNLEKDVLLLGARGDVPELLQAADVFLLPSKFEGLGLSAVESQSAGLPTLVSDQVPSDVAITDLVFFLPLDSLSRWVEVISDYSQVRERKNTYQDIVDAHYEIHQTIKDLIDFYQKII